MQTKHNTCDQETNREMNPEMKLVKEKPGMGSPSSYRGEYAEQVVKLCRLGMPDQEIEGFYGVNVATLRCWESEHPEYLQSVKHGKTLADAEVADSLYRRACGYSHVAVKFATHNGIITDREEYVKHYPPDTQACIFWLKNRRPDLWREKVEMQVSEPEAPISSEEERQLTPEDEEFNRRIADFRIQIRQEQGLMPLEPEPQQQQHYQQQDAQPDSQQATSDDTSEDTPEGDPNSLEAIINRSPYETKRLRSVEFMREWREGQQQGPREDELRPPYIVW